MVVNCNLKYYLFSYKRPNFMKWAEQKMGIDKNLVTPPKEKVEVV